MPTHYESDNNKFSSQPDAMGQAHLWDLISIYADGEATPTETQRVEAMLHQDPAIAHELAFLQRTSMAVRTLTEVEPPATLRAAIYARTTRRPTLKRRIGRTWDRLLTSLAPRPLLRLSIAGGACLAAGLVIALVAPHGQVPIAGVQHPVQPGSRNLALIPPHVASPAFQPVIMIPAEVQSSASHDVVAKVTLHHHADVRNRVAPQVVAYNGINARDTMSVSTARWIAHNPELRTELPTSEPKRGPALVEMQKPRAHDHNADDDLAASYSHLPKMDEVNQRARVIMASTTNDSLGENIDTNREDTGAIANKKVEKVVEDAPKKTIRVVRLSQLPPDARRYLTSADIKREMDARNLGFNRTTMEGIKREEATVTLIDSKF